MKLISFLETDSDVIVYRSARTLASIDLLMLLEWLSMMSSFVNRGSGGLMSRKVVTVSSHISRTGVQLTFFVELFRILQVCDCE